MTHLERFLATIERRPVDRPASWLGFPAPDAEPGLCRAFGVETIDDVKFAVDDDVWPIQFPYHSPTSDAIYMAFDWDGSRTFTLTGEGFFGDDEDPGRVDAFDWPNPEACIDPDECRAAAAAVPDGYAALLCAWSAHFQDACAAFNMQKALMKMVTHPEMVRAVIDRIVDFYLRANEIFYEATKDRIHAVLIGNDFGTQRGLLVSPALLRDLVLPGTKALIDQAHAYGLKVIHHSCGSIHDVIDDLIAAGADAIHPIQALAADMDAATLQHDFAGRTSFCGGVDAQELLVHGSPDDVRRKVRELKDRFPTGLIVSPSHEAVLPDIRPENIRALFEEVHAA